MTKRHAMHFIKKSSLPKSTNLNVSKSMKEVRWMIGYIIQRLSRWAMSKQNTFLRRYVCAGFKNCFANSCFPILWQSCTRKYNLDPRESPKIGTLTLRTNYLDWKNGCQILLKSKNICDLFSCFRDIYHFSIAIDHFCAWKGWIYPSEICTFAEKARN